MIESARLAFSFGISPQMGPINSRSGGYAGLSTESPSAYDDRFSGSVHELDFARAPALVEKRFEWAVEAQDHPVPVTRMAMAGVMPA
jgi:hypothetical protein